jgi:hypothetical protein
MFQKSVGREHTSNLGTEPPSYVSEEPTTMKAHHKEHTHHPGSKTTQPTRTSITTESHFARLLAPNTTETIKPPNFTKSTSFPESATSTTIFERDGISDHSESKSSTAQQPISSSGTSITETEDPIKNLTTPASAFSNITSATDSTSVNNQSAFTTDNESTLSHSSTASSMHSTTDRSTAPYNATFDVTDTESTTPTDLLASSSSSRPDSQPIHTSVITVITSSGTSITETEDPIKNLTTQASAFSNITSATDSTSVNNQSAFTTDNESTISHSSSAPSMHSTTDRSTAPYNATFDVTDTESTTPTDLLTSSSSSRPDSQPIHTSVITDTSTDSTAITSATGVTDATDSSVSDFGDLSSRSISTEPLTDISMILTTTDGPLHMSVTGPTTAAVTDSSMSTQHSPTASDETSVMSQSLKSQEIIAYATVATG